MYTKKDNKKKTVTPVDSFLEEFRGYNEGASYPTDLKEAIIGSVERFGQDPPYFG